MTAGEFVYLITADDSKLNSSLSKSENGVKEWGGKLTSWTVAKGQMIANFATKAVTRVGSLAKGVFKETLNAYKTFEQLEGGTRLLFEKSADTVFKYAKTAYQRVQMSQNEYLEQANAFATGLKTSLNGDAEAAANLADKIITAQADVVAATGASQEAVQNAFRGVMRGNYTMLDNLQLGITPTKKGMEDLIKTVNDWNKANGKATKYQMGNLADMQSALVDYIDKVGMAGYADKEARGTIEGSMASTKAAWQDLLVAFGSGKDVKQATKNFAKSAKDMFKNMLPVFRETIHGIGDFVKEVLPEIKTGLNDIITEFKNSDSPVLQTIGSGLEFVRDALSGLISLITDFPGTVEKLKQSDSPILQALGSGLELAKNGLEWIKNNQSTVVSAITAIGGAFATWKVIQGLDKVISTVRHLFGGNPKVPGTPIPSAQQTTLPVGKAGWLSNTLASISKLKAPAAAAVFAATLLDTEMGLFNGSRDRELYGQFFDDNGKPTKAGIEAGYSENDIEVQRSAAYSTWKHDPTIANLEGLLSFKDYNKDAFSFLKEISGASMTGEWLTAFQERFTNWINDAPDPQLHAAMGEIDQEFYDRFKEMIEDFGLADGAHDPMAYDELFTELQEQLQEKLSESPYKAEVEPQLDISSLLQQLNSQHYTIPVSPSWQFPWMKQAKGDWSVPYDNYPSLLHRGEMVLTASQARKYRDGEGNMDYSIVGEMIGSAIEHAMGRVNVLLSGDKVGNLTTKRVRNNINAQNAAVVRGMGG